MAMRADAKTVWGPVPLRDSRSLDLTKLGSFFKNVPVPAGDLPNVQLKLEVAGYAQAANPKDDASDTEYYVVADMATDSSTVGPGSQVVNDDEKCGFYTHSVDVQLWFEDSAYAVDQDTPASSAASGSGSNSSGTTETFGFFGDQLTGTVSSTASQGGVAYL
jgi:hypothetical protein